MEGGMSEPPDDDGNNDSGRPSNVLFSVVRSPSRELLTESGFRVFSGASFSLWFLLILAIWRLNVRIDVDRQTITDIVAASVGLATVSIAILTILSALNRVDRWLKLGFMVVTLLFVSAICGAFSVALTIDAPFLIRQHMTLFIVSVVGIATVVQLEGVVSPIRIQWTGFMRPKTVLWRPKRSILMKTRIVAQCITAPLLLPWFRWNGVMGTIVAFAGALLLLIILVCVTTISLAFIYGRKKDATQEVMEQQAEEQARAHQRVEQNRAAIVEALQRLQAEEICKSKQRQESSPLPVDVAALEAKLWTYDIQGDRRDFRRALDTLISERRVCDRFKCNAAGRVITGVWLFPSPEVVQQCKETVFQQNLLLTSIDVQTKIDSQTCVIAGMDLTRLRNRLIEVHALPSDVIGTYIMPYMIEALEDEHHFIRLIRPSDSGGASVLGASVLVCLFINATWICDVAAWDAACAAEDRQFRYLNELRDLFDAFPNCILEKAAEQEVSFGIVRWVKKTVGRVLEARRNQEGAVNAFDATP